MRESRRSWTSRDKPYACHVAGCSRSYFFVHDLRRHEKQKHLDLLRQGVIGPGITGIAPGDGESSGTVEAAEALASVAATESSAEDGFLPKASIAVLPVFENRQLFVYSEGASTCTTATLATPAHLLPAPIPSVIEGSKSVHARSAEQYHAESQSKGTPSIAPTMFSHMSLEQIAAVTGIGLSPQHPSTSAHTVVVSEVPRGEHISAHHGEQEVGVDTGEGANNSDHNNGRGHE